MELACGQLFSGVTADAFKDVKFAAKYAGNARKEGVDPLDLIDVEMQFLSLFYGEAVNRLMLLDLEAPLDHPGLQKGYMAVRKFGDKLLKATEKPEKFSALKQVGALKSVFRAIDGAFGTQ